MEGMRRCSFGNDNFKREASRCIYESDDILLPHAFMTFANGSTEEVMWIAPKGDGLIHTVETGSTPISR